MVMGEGKSPRLTHRWSWVGRYMSGGCCALNGLNRTGLNWARYLGCALGRQAGMVRE